MSEAVAFAGFLPVRPWRPVIGVIAAFAVRVGVFVRRRWHDDPGGGDDRRLYV